MKRAGHQRRTERLEGFWISSSPDDTEALGSQLAQSLSPGDVVACYGELGSGKSVFVRGVCRGLGVADSVTSPTFTLIHHYTGRLPIYHFDFYRIRCEEDVRTLGLDEYFYDDGVCLIEWPERVANLLPARRVEVHLSHHWAAESGSERKVEIVWKG